MDTKKLVEKESETLQNLQFLEACFNGNREKIDMLIK